MISVHELKDMDPSIVAKPNYSNLNGVRVIDNILIDLNKIYYDEAGNNIRSNGQDPAHIESLKLSFAQGVDISEFPPGVIQRKGKTDKFTHDLVYGFGRFASLMELGVKKYPVTLLDVDNESALDDVKVNENETKPKSENSEMDIKSAISKKIIKGWIANDEDVIREEIKRICSYRKKQSVDRIVQAVISDRKTPQKFQFYSPAKAQQWLNNNSSEEYIIGDFDDKRDMFGYLVKEGYQYRFVMNAIRNYALYGKKSYCIVHVGSPSGKSTIEVKRKQFVDELNQITKNFLFVSNNGIVVWEIMGFLPQILGIEDWKTLIKLV
jgi:hypothetical protein